MNLTFRLLLKTTFFDLINKMHHLELHLYPQLNLFLTLLTMISYNWVENDKFSFMSQIQTFSNPRVFMIN